MKPSKNANKNKGNTFQFKKTKNADSQIRPGLAGLGQRLRMEEAARERESCIPKAPFARLVREIADQFKYDLKFQRVAIEALQESAEAFLLHIFEDSYLCTTHAKRMTLMPSDMKLSIRLGKHPALQNHQASKF